jgi:hypothetical protein
MKTKFFSAITFLAVSLALTAQGKDQFVAHEWGTFTSVQGADGAQIVWRPSIATDLPKFVYSRDVANGGFRGNALSDPFGKGVMTSFVRMETPVIYFYSDKERTADVRVRFPQGRVTEWYPQATHVGPYSTTNKSEFVQAARSGIEWNGVKILPRNTKEISAEKLIRERQGHETEHYYAARETDANFLRMDAPSARAGKEYERDLFYRGVGYFRAPLTMKMDSSETHLTLFSAHSEPLTDLFVLTIQRGQARYQVVNRVTDKQEQTVPLSAKPFAKLSEVRPNLMRDMAAALTRQGLYAKEAQAMVETWKDQWFAEEGTRVLYLLPAKWTDQTLPLEITPKPDQTVRVMVGRAELITPSTEKMLRQQVTSYHRGDAATKRQALVEVRQLGLGRFLEAATRRITGQMNDKDLSATAWTVANEAGKPEVGATTAFVNGASRAAN